MTVGVGSLRCSVRAVLGDLLQLSRPNLRQQTLRFSTASIARAEAEVAAPAAADAANEPPPTWEQTRDKTRLVPVSPSYFTGNPGFYDNWLALQELLRKYQTLPTVPMAEAPPAKWKTLAQYRGIVGTTVKASRYKKICNVLDRLNCINPSLIPREVSSALDMYRRDERQIESQAKPQVLDHLGRARAVGRRKTSVARVLLSEGTGEVLVNGTPLAQVFERLHDRESAVFPLLATGRMDKYNVWATVMGGGKTGQAEAITLGVARALLIHEPALKPALRRGEFKAILFSFFHLNMVSDFLQLALSLVIPGWLNVRSPVTSRLARCLPGSSVKGMEDSLYLYSGSVYNINGYWLEFIPLVETRSQSVVVDCQCVICEPHNAKYDTTNPI
jgi:small subunit ribosomal protein S9